MVIASQCLVAIAKFICVVRKTSTTDGDRFVIVAFLRGKNKVTSFVPLLQLSKSPISLKMLPEIRSRRSIGVEFVLSCCFVADRPQRNGREVCYR